MSEKQRKQGTARVKPKVEVIRHGRDEMNLVEYPFASLWKNTEPGTEILHEWETTHPASGKVLKAFWRVAGDPKLGLPTATDEQVYLVLMELTQESGLASQTVHFTRHNLLKRLGWIHNDKNYRLLEEAFTRLAAVSITSQNAFWNARARSFETVGFSLLDNFKILVERTGRKKPGQAELPLSFFKWNDVLFESFQAGYIRSIDVGFVLTLKGSIALRLYRYLDKKAYGRRSGFEIELVGLCERHLGMRPSQYPSKYKERLKPAHEELMARGFLQAVAYEPMKTKKGEKVCYTFANRAASAACDLSLAQTQTDHVQSAPLPTSRPVAASGPATGQATEESEALLARILALKVSPDVARELVQSASPEQLLLQLDCLEDRQPRNRAATFVKAVREKWDAPPKYLERQKTAESERREQQTREAAQAARAQQKAEERQREAVGDEEAARLDAAWEHMDAPSRKRIENEVRERLGVLGQPGRAQGALMAMRRNLMREQGILKQDGVHPTCGDGQDP